MTIMSKEGASTSPVPGGYPNPTGASSHKDNKDPLEPPSYSETIAEDGPSGSQQGLPPASNYNTVFKQNGCINGTWVIDTNIEVPAALRQPPSLFNGFKEQENLSLVTQNGSIEAAIHLTAISHTERRAIVKVRTQNGKLVIKLHRENNQPIKFSGNSRNGSVAVAIPRNYAGPLKCKTGWGNLTFSEAMQHKVATFSKDTAFVGDWATAGFKDYKSWTGDEIEIDTANGNISFMYIDEAGSTFGKGIEGTVESAVRNFLGWFGVPS